MKNSLIIALVLFFYPKISCTNPLAAVSFDGCASPRVESNIGLRIQYSQFGSLGTIYVPSYVSYTLQIGGAMYCVALTKISLYRNGVLLKEVPVSGQGYGLELRTFPGSYRLVVDFASSHLYPRYCDWTYDIVDNPTGMEDVENEKKLTIYPNPAQTQIHLEANEEMKTVTLFDVSGAQISMTEINAAKTELPLDQIPAGVYFLRVATLSNKIVIKKLVIL